MKDARIKQQLEQLAEQVALAHVEARKKIAPGLAEFVSDFNGQQFGRSRPSLKGERVMIQSVFLHADGTYNFHAFRTESGKPIDAGFFPKDVRFI